MTYYLDTNICVYFLKGTHSFLKNRLLSENPDNIKIPAIVKAELLYGAEKSRKREENLEKVRQFLFPFETADFGSAQADEYAKIRAGLEKDGPIIGPNDLIIAAIVKSGFGILVTNNIKEFQRVPGLELDNWLAEMRI